MHGRRGGDSSGGEPRGDDVKISFPQLLSAAAGAWSARVENAVYLVPLQTR